MKLKEAIRYTYGKILGVSLIYYLFMLIVRIGSIFSDMELLPENENLTLTFLSIVILAIFPSTFRFLLQNGCSRQTVHKTMLLFVPIAALFPILDYALIFLSAFFRNMRLLSAKHLPAGAKDVLAVLAEKEYGYKMVMAIGYCILLFALAYFVSVLFLRLKTVGRILVCIIVPAVWILGAQLMNMAEHAPETAFIYRAYEFIMDWLINFLYGAGAISYAIGFFVLSIIVFSVTHLMIRTVKVRK